MDIKYKNCVNPILAVLSYKKTKYFRDEKSGLTILGNLKHLSKIKGTKFVLDLMKDENVIKLPCRQCITCAMKKAREWSVRNCLEAREYDDTEKWFVTLTYDNDNASFSNKFMTLSRAHITSFMKKLRSKFPNDRIRFFCCGEYGSKTYRPHYHLILYGIHFKNSDFEFLFSKKSHNKTFNYYRCFPIEESWLKGITTTCNFEDAEASYVSQYTTKKINNYKNPYYYLKEKKILPEFVQMSRKPGIAYNYFQKHKEEMYIDKNDKLIYHTDYKTVHIKPFEFFDRLFDIENPEFMQFIKENRKAYGLNYDFFKNYDLDVPLYQFLDDTGRTFKNKLKGDNGFENYS